MHTHFVGLVRSWLICPAKNTLHRVWIAQGITVPCHLCAPDLILGIGMWQGSGRQTKSRAIGIGMGQGSGRQTKIGLSSLACGRVVITRQRVGYYSQLVTAMQCF